MVGLPIMLSAYDVTVPQSAEEAIIFAKQQRMTLRGMAEKIVMDTEKELTR